MEANIVTGQLKSIMVEEVNHRCLKLTLCPGWTVKYDRFRDDVSPGLYIEKSKLCFNQMKIFGGVKIFLLPVFLLAV